MNRPLPALSGTEPVGFVSDPDQRGTVSLLLSCILTLVLCVWSALHLNVPKPGCSPAERGLQYTAWILSGLFRPEFLVVTAWRQRATAKTLTSVVQKACESKSELRCSHGGQGSGSSEPSLATSNQQSAATSPNRYPWTLTHSFFAAGGGFVLELEANLDKTERYLPNECPKRLALTAQGIALLAKCGIVPDVPEAEIWDKSKANGLAKLLIVVQAAWMLVQIIARLASRLPVTLLEVSTAAHVSVTTSLFPTALANAVSCCLFLIYVMWWKKPYASGEPVMLTGPWVDMIGSYMYMSSDVSYVAEHDLSQRRKRARLLYTLLDSRPKCSELEKVALRIPKQPEVPLNAAVAAAPRQSFEPASETCAKLVLERKQKEVSYGVNSEKAKNWESGVLSEVQQPSQVTRNRWTLASAAVAAFPELIEGSVFLDHDNGKCVHFKRRELVAAEIPNSPQNDILGVDNSQLVTLVMSFADGFWGAFHAAAWYNAFPTDIEAWLWRASSCYICGCALLSTGLYYTALKTGLEDKMDKAISSMRRLAWWQRLPIYIPLWILGCVFLGARGYLVVEAFVSVRALPPQAYVTPSWIQLFPHF